ncbi:hypothetical protein BJX99DRAFT_234271 [Aspergillus californicus]
MYRSDAASFNPELVNNTFFMFGRGALLPWTLEIFGLVALLINRYDMKLAWPAAFPRRNESLIILGHLTASARDDLEVTLDWKK